MKYSYSVIAALVFPLCMDAASPTNLVTSQSMKKQAISTPPQQKLTQSEWKLLGDANLVDGWVVPGLAVTPGEYLDPANYSFEVEIYESTVTPNVYKLISPWTSDKFPFIDLNKNKEPHDIIIDASNPDFVKMEPQVSGFVHVNHESKANYSDPFYICNSGSYYLSEGNSESDIIEFGFNSTLKDGKINIVVPRFGKSATGSGFGYNWMDEKPSVITLPDNESPDEGKWEDVGMATYVDGFIYPGYYGDPENAGWKVQLQEKSGNPGLYRLVNPYLVENPLLDSNDNTSQTYVVIDATDPDIVVIEPQYSGFTSPIDGKPFNFYIGNNAGIYVAEGIEKSVLKESLGKEKLDTMRDGIITITNQYYGSNATTDFGYIWVDDNDQPISYPTKMILPGVSGVDGISADESLDQAAEYFTLQGLQVTNPSAPGIYIKRQGTNVSKIIIK